MEIDKLFSPEYQHKGATESGAKKSEPAVTELLIGTNGRTQQTSLLTTEKYGTGKPRREIIRTKVVE